MNIAEFIRYLTPDGTDAWSSLGRPSHSGLATEWKCPNWPADLFAISASIIERSGCYTAASPDRNALKTHAAYLRKVKKVAGAWNSEPGNPPIAIEKLWDTLFSTYGGVEMVGVAQSPDVVRILLTLFAVADEACMGMGWDVSDDALEAGFFFAAITMWSMADPGAADLLLRHVPTSLCVAVPPDRAVVLPKSLTPSVGCTIAR